MHVTVCIGTRNRERMCVAAVQSVMRSDYEDFDVLVIDQGDDSTLGERLTEQFGPDARIRHVSSSRAGASAARNSGAALARGPIVAFTDDDCEVAPEWLTAIVRAFEQEPRVAVVFGTVRSGVEREGGFVPDYPILRPRLLTRPVEMWRSHGISANMAFRIERLRDVGGFDEVLGHGAPLPSCEDWDVAYRVLKSGGWVLELPDAVVVHYGFRTWDQARSLMRTTGFAAGATWMKHLRLLDIFVVPTLALNAFHGVSWQRVARLQSRSGAMWPVTYLRGVLASFRYDVDRADRTYRMKPQVANP